MDFTSERKNVHELANHLTVAQGAVRKVLRNLHDKQLEQSEEYQRLQKADDVLKKGIENLQHLREALVQKTEQLKDS